MKKKNKLLKQWEILKKEYNFCRGGGIEKVFTNKHLILRGWWV